MYKKILVAVDGSAPSLRGLDEAIKVAKGVGGQLMLVHVVNELVTAADYVPSVYFEGLIQIAARNRHKGSGAGCDDCAARGGVDRAEASRDRRRASGGRDRQAGKGLAGRSHRHGYARPSRTQTTGIGQRRRARPATVFCACAPGPG